MVDRNREERLTYRITSRDLHRIGRYAFDSMHASGSIVLPHSLWRWARKEAWRRNRALDLITNSHRRFAVHLIRSMVIITLEEN